MPKRLSGEKKIMKKLIYWEATVMGCTYQGSPPCVYGRTLDELKLRMGENRYGSFSEPRRMIVEYKDEFELATECRMARKLRPEEDVCSECGGAGWVAPSLSGAVMGVCHVCHGEGMKLQPTERKPQMLDICCGNPTWCTCVNCAPEVKP